MKTLTLFFQAPVSLDGVKVLEMKSWAEFNKIKTMIGSQVFREAKLKEKAVLKAKKIVEVSTLGIVEEKK